MKPPRTLWQGFPDALVLATEQHTKRHRDYAAAKGGSIPAAVNLIADLVTDADIAAAVRQGGARRR